MPTERRSEYDQRETTVTSQRKCRKRSGDKKEVEGGREKVCRHTVASACPIPILHAVMILVRTTNKHYTMWSVRNTSPEPLWGRCQ